MSEFTDMYKKMMKQRTCGGASEIRMRQAQETYCRNFADINGHKQAQMLDAISVNDDREFLAKGKIDELKKDLDIIISTSTNGYERIITCRPNVLLKNGTYIYYNELGVEKVAIIRELLKAEPLPTYKAFECSQVLKIKNCPFVFPCFSYNSTYSSKGLIDTDRNYILDSRNKLYIQKNKYSCRLWKEYYGYRIILGDEDGTIVFKITEMDDFSYKGMFIVSLKVEQRHHLDGEDDILLAYNDKEIDFSDLLPTVVPLELNSNTYYKTGDYIEIISNKPINNWIYDNSFFDSITSENVSKEYTNKDGSVSITTFGYLRGTLSNKEGILKVEAIDFDGMKVTKNIMIKKGT